MNNKDVLSKGSGNQWIKCLQATTTKTDLNLSVTQHHKNNQSNERKEQTHQDGNPVRSNMTYSGGESSPPIH